MLVARDLHVGTQVAHQHNINTITLGGDRVDKKGAMTGGYIYSKISKLEAQAEIRVSGGASTCSKCMDRNVAGLWMCACCVCVQRLTRDMFVM